MKYRQIRFALPEIGMELLVEEWPGHVPQVSVRAEGDDVWGLPVDSVSDEVKETIR